MSIAEDILGLIEPKRRRYVTELDIAAMLFGQDKAYHQRVNSACRQLVQQGELVRHGKGGPTDPYTYSLPSVKRRRISD